MVVNPGIFSGLLLQGISSAVIRITGSEDGREILRGKQPSNTVAVIFPVGRFEMRFDQIAVTGGNGHQDNRYTDAGSFLQYSPLDIIFHAERPQVKLLLIAFGFLSVEFVSAEHFTAKTWGFQAVFQVAPDVIVICGLVQKFDSPERCTCSAFIAPDGVAEDFVFIPFFR